MVTAAEVRRLRKLERKERKAQQQREAVAAALLGVPDTREPSPATPSKDDKAKRKKKRKKKGEEDASEASILVEELPTPVLLPQPAASTLADNPPIIKAAEVASRVQPDQPAQPALPSAEPTRPGNPIPVSDPPAADIPPSPERRASNQPEKAASPPLPELQQSSSLQCANNHIALHHVFPKTPLVGLGTEGVPPMKLFPAPAAYFPTQQEDDITPLTRQGNQQAEAKVRGFAASAVARSHFAWRVDYGS